jgi:galactitol-specific phosphotransferase system IIB component
VSNTNKTEDVFKKKVEELCKDLSFSHNISLPDFDNWENYPERKTIVIEVRCHDTSFDDLVNVSQKFGTKNINLGSEIHEGGHCETCAYSYTVNLIRIKDWTVEI